MPLVDGLVITPANADAAEASLGLVRRIQARHPGKVKTLIGELLYSNLKADRWAIPLAQLGVEQSLDMSADQHGVLGVIGGQPQHAWLYCPSAPLEHKPAVPDSRTASSEEWTDFHKESNAFRARWAFDRKESGLRTGTTKWVCPAMAGKVGCPARGTVSVAVAVEYNLPVTEPPTDWKERACCTQRTVDITHDSLVPALQRKLMQREYYGSEPWRKVRKLRSYVEGVFGVLKNPSRQRLTRGQNRLPGLTMATLIAGLKVAVYNEETIRTWHERTGRGPAGHPLLQDDPAYHGFGHLTEEQAAAINQQHVVALGAPSIPAPRTTSEAAQSVAENMTPR